jgi:hypothetical protein
MLLTAAPALLPTPRPLAQVAALAGGARLLLRARYHCGQRGALLADDDDFFKEDHAVIGLRSLMTQRRQAAASHALQKRVSSCSMFGGGCTEQCTARVAALAATAPPTSKPAGWLPPRPRRCQPVMAPAPPPRVPPPAAPAAMAAAVKVVSTGACTASPMPRRSCCSGWWRSRARSTHWCTR